MSKLRCCVRCDGEYQAYEKGLAMQDIGWVCRDEAQCNRDRLDAVECGLDNLRDKTTRLDRLETRILEHMVYQFGYWQVREGVGGFGSGGLSALEDALELLGHGDFLPAPDVECDEKGCHDRSTCGFPTDKGYRRTCYDHSQMKKDNQNRGRKGSR